MSSRSNRPRTRKDLSRAELKAYESRRAAERRRIGTATAAATATTAEVEQPVRVATEHSFAIARDEEYTVIRADLIRLLKIMAVLAVALVVLTIVLR